MSNVLPLDRPPVWLFSIEVHRQPDGVLVAQLGDCRQSLLDEPGDPKDKLLAMIHQTKVGLREMERRARLIGG